MKQLWILRGQLAVAQAIVKESTISGWGEVERQEQAKAERAGRFEKRLYLQSTGHQDSIEGNAFESDKARKTGGQSLRIALTPPLLTKPQSKSLHFPDFGLEIIVEYKEYDVKVSLRRTTRSGEVAPRQQLPLFSSKRTKSTRRR